MGCSVTNSFDGNIFPRKWVEQLEEIKFESTTFAAFRDRHECLTFFYGDYMTPPPMEERQGHLPSNIDFGPYQ